MQLRLLLAVFCHPATAPIALFLKSTWSPTRAAYPSLIPTPPSRLKPTLNRQGQNSIHPPLCRRVAHSQPGSPTLTQGELDASQA